MDDHELRSLLRAHGHRVTGVRLRVHAALRDAEGHPTADELVAALGAPGGVSVSSVYRSLDVLEQLGVVRSTRLGQGDVTRWELAHPDEAFHVECTACGTVRHHHGSLVALVTDHLDADHGFVADEVRLLVRGRCLPCRGDAGAAPPPRAAAWEPGA